MFFSPLDIEEHINDYDWLNEHIDVILRQISDGLEYMSTAQEAIRQLNLIMPYALTRHDYTRWHDPLYAAMLHAMELKDEEFQIQIWSHLGNYYFQKADYRTAATTFRKALEHPDIDATPEMELLARIGMLRTKTIFETMDINLFIKQTLKAARSIKSYALLGKLYYTLAIAYTYQAETRKALGYGQMALACWYQENNAAEKERVALGLAEICRIARCHTQAGRFLELVRPGSENIYLTGIYHYLTGSSLFEREQVLEALPHLEQALRQFKALDFPYITGAAYHALALAQTKLRDFEIARANLRLALIIWQKLDNKYEQANCVYAWGFLEEMAKDREAARKLYEKGIQLSKGVAETSLLIQLRLELEEHLEAVRA